MGPKHSRMSAPATKGRTIGWAHHYDAVVWLLTMGKARTIRKMNVEMADVKPGERILDVGCGTGDLTIAASGPAGAKGKLYGIDASPEMIEVALHKAAQAGIEIDFQVGLIEALDFPDGTFDLVLSSLMIHHLPDDLKRQGLAEIRRVLKPGGRVLIVDFKPPTSWLGRFLITLMLHGKTENGIKDLPELMRELGFSDLQSGNTNFGLLGFVRGLVR